MAKSEIEILREENAGLKEDLHGLFEEFEDVLESVRALILYASDIPNVVPEEGTAEEQENLKAKLKEIHERRYDQAKLAGYRGSLEEYLETLG